MRLSNETGTARAWIMGAALAVAALLVFSHVHAMRQYLAIASGMGLRGQMPSTPLTQVYPAFAADAQTWVRHAVALTEEKTLRLRYTTIDNAPDGRPVHWNSAWAWTIALAGYFDHWLSDAPLPQAIERATLWLPGLALLLLAAVVGGWTARRAGALAGVIVLLALIGHARIYEGFFPSYVDHHGLLTMAVVGLVLGSVLMGAGWWRPAKSSTGMEILPASIALARSSAVFSAVSGAFGLWVSAASVIPAIVIIGVAAVASTLLLSKRMRTSGASFDPQVWRIWGRVGAAGSLVFYLIEYFPSQIGLRMEANHPFYGLAWLGGGELVAQICERLQRAPGRRMENWQSLVPAALAVMIAPLVILIGGAAVFIVRDSFLAELHRLYIAEFLPLWRSIKGKGWSQFFTLVGAENLPLLIGVGVLAVRRREAPLLVWFSTMATLGFTAMAWTQSRWLLNASGSQVALALVLLGYFSRNLKPLVRWSATGLVVGVLFLYPAVKRVTDGQRDVANRRVSPADAGNALARDLAKIIRSSQPEGPIVLLTNPNSSTNVGYYGRFQTLGTLYWENLEGLKSAAEIFSAKSPREAAVLIRQHRVTHIAMVSEENFIAQYHQLLNPAATTEDLKKSFGYQLLVDRTIPPWLQLIPYQAPDDLKALNASVLLFRVAFEQTPADALYHLAIGKIAMGSVADAERDLDVLIQRSPESFQPWLRKGELLFARRDWPAAAETLLQGILRAPADQQPALFVSTAGGFYRERQHRETVLVYRTALKTRFDPLIAGYLAFVLSTSADDSVRDGKAALPLIETAVQQDAGSPTLLNAYAATLAELGRFPDAVTVAERALAIATQRQETTMQELTRRRLEAYRAGQAWRE